MALVAMCFSAGAQSLNLSSAYEAQNRGYLKKAKGYIDQAAVHEQTKAEPQTWFYSTLIYCKIGGEIKNNTKQGKELKTLASDWYRTAYQSVLNWKQFDKSGEYTQKITPFFAYIANTYYDLANESYRSGEYQKAISFCDTAIQMFNMDPQSKANTQITNYLAGVAATAMKDNSLVKKYFNPLVSGRYNNDYVYNTLFNIYCQEGDTTAAVKVAHTYRKNFPDSLQADQLMAKAYLFNGNMEKAQECLMAALDKQKNNPAAQSVLLSGIATIFSDKDQSGYDYDKAYEYYQKSLAIDAKQFNANYGLATLIYNRAIDKLSAANDVDPNDETGLYDKLLAESKDYFGQATQYFVNAIAFIDGLDAKGQEMNINNLSNCLYALRNIYLRTEKTDDYKAINERYNNLQKQ